MKQLLILSFLFLPFSVFSQNDTLVRTKEKAISIAEPILFKTYGKKQIKRERPYHAELKDGLWYITGTLHSELGGVFLIVINSKNGEIIKVTHGK